MKNFLEGRAFPYGNLSQEDWQAYVSKIVNLVNHDLFVKKIIELDGEYFLRVIIKLFSGTTYQIY